MQIGSRLARIESIDRKSRRFKSGERKSFPNLSPISRSQCFAVLTNVFRISRHNEIISVRRMKREKKEKEEREKEKEKN